MLPHLMRLLLATLLAANAAAGSLAIAAPKAPKKPETEFRAERVFKNADANQDGVLDATEQANAQDPAEKEIKKLLDNNKHHPPLPEVPAPELADRNAMTAAEFVQYFKSLAGRKDAANRGKKKKPGGVSGASPAPSGPPGNVRKEKPDDDEKTPRRRVEGIGPGAPPPGGTAVAPPLRVVGPPPIPPVVSRPTLPKEPGGREPRGSAGGKGEPTNGPEKPGKHEPPGNGGKHHGGK